MAKPRNPEKRKNIIEKSAELFKVKGFVATSMRDIAEAVGLEASSLYNHIPSKQAILEEICLKKADLFLNEIEKIEVSEMEEVKKLEGIARFHIRMMTKNPCEATVFSTEWRHLNENDLKVFLKKRKTYENKLLQIIKNGVLKRNIRNVNEKVILHTFLSSFQWVQHWYKKGKMSAKKLEGELVELMMNGLK